MANDLVQEQFWEIEDTFKSGNELLWSYAIKRLGMSGCKKNSPEYDLVHRYFKRLLNVDPYEIEQPVQIEPIKKTIGKRKGLFETKKNYKEAKIMIAYLKK